jgi:hypothetical protein
MRRRADILHGQTYRFRTDGATLFQQNLAGLVLSTVGAGDAGADKTVRTWT